MTNTLSIVLAQLNLSVGAIEDNAQKIITAITTARDNLKANLIVFSELALSGYPPEDLLYRADFHQRIAASLATICEAADGIDVILGYPAHTPAGCYNRGAFIRNQQISQYYDKQQLPNYSIFDELRYFQSGPPNACVVEVQGIKIALIICEDLWHPQPMTQAVVAGAELIVCINASPFAADKAQRRLETIKQRINEAHLPVLYLNCLGGQDELVFDGGSMVVDANAHILQQAAFFKESLVTLNISKSAENFLQLSPVMLAPVLSHEARIYQALVLGLKDYIEKNAFTRVLLGLSGGIDSALTLAIAVDAVGKERVQALMLPSRYNSAISLIDARLQAENMGVSHQVLSIEPAFQAFLDSLQPLFAGLPVDITEENLQARCRGTLLMAVANKTQALVLITSNKSEMAVGYSTLYGDMAGGFCVLKDVFKTMVYRLAHYRNSLSAVIPERVLSRAPSAELAANQQDQDSLPPYPILDEILRRYIEQDQSLSSIIQAGFDAATVRRVVKMVDRNEYKRRQAAPGTRISERAFGKDRRYPITSGFKPF